jgi:hypothetical protein
VSGLTQVKLGLAAIGLILWGYGYRVDDARLRLIGIGFLAAAAILRFVKRGPPPRDGTPAT